MMNDEFKDYFESYNEPEEKPQEETPEQREEREIKETTIERRYNKKRLFVISFVSALALFVIIWTWLRYFHPYATSQETGVIMKVSNEGNLFKTYEGKMISEVYIIDTVTTFESNFDFTITDDSVARQAMELAGTGRRVTLDYKYYKGKLPWRGESNRIVTKITLKEPD